MHWGMNTHQYILLYTSHVECLWYTMYIEHTVDIAAITMLCSRCWMLSGSMVVSARAMSAKDMAPFLSGYLHYTFYMVPYR